MTSTDTATRTYTAYAAAKLVNAELAALALPAIPAQMIYNYTKSGRIPTVQVGDKRHVDEVELAKWFAGYVQRKADKAAKLTGAIAAVTADEPEVEDNTIPLFEIDAK